MTKRLISPEVTSVCTSMQAVESACHRRNRSRSTRKKAKLNSSGMHSIPQSPAMSSSWRSVSGVSLAWAESLASDSMPACRDASTRTTTASTGPAIRGSCVDISQSLVAGVMSAWVTSRVALSPLGADYSQLHRLEASQPGGEGGRRIARAAQVEAQEACGGIDRPVAGGADPTRWLAG
nr:hypothetical protein [Novosphingobium sp. G106]